MDKAKKIVLFWAGWLGLPFLIFLLANVCFGSSIIMPWEVINSIINSVDNDTSAIVWQFRLPKAVTCILAGVALATGGLLMQTLFRNPLAGPDVLGLSSGASLLVAMLLMLGRANSAFLQSLATSPWSLAIAASVGSSFVFLLIIVVNKAIRDNASLLLIGLMISAATASIVGVIQYLSQAENLQLFMIWSLGNVGGTSWKEIGVMTLIISLGLTIAVSQLKSLNARLLGETYAQSLGINLEKSRFWIVTATSLLAGSITAFCGPIAFVGLAVPHFMRLLAPTADHKFLLPCSMLGGATLLLFCDWVAHLFGTTIIPLNAITSIIGAPLVIWMIIKNKKVSI